MAEGSVSYTITFTEGTGRTLKDGDTVQTQIKRTRGETFPDGVVIKGGEIRFSKIYVNSTLEPYLQFEDYFRTDGMPVRHEYGFLRVGISDISNSVMELIDLYVTATVVCRNSQVSAMILRESGTATLVVDYGDPDPEDPEDPGGSGKPTYDVLVIDQQLLYTDTISTEEGIPFLMSHAGTSETNVDVTFSISSGSPSADGQIFQYRDDLDYPTWTDCSSIIPLGYGQRVPGRNSIPTQFYIRTTTVPSSACSFWMWISGTVHESKYENYGEYQEYHGQSYVIREDVTRCQPPASVTINGELLGDQIVSSSKAFLTLHDAYEGKNNPIRGYEITYHSFGSIFGEWSSEQEYKTILTDKRSLSIEVDVSSYKRKYVVRTLGTRTEDTYNSYKTSLPTIQMTQFTAGSGVTELLLEKALSTSDVKLIWRGAGFDESAEAVQLPIQHYTIQRSESPDGRTWSEWEDLQNDCGYPPLPSFEYTGEYTAEPHEAYGWLITLKTSGELTFYDDVDVDIFAVGGGGSGGGTKRTSQYQVIQYRGGGGGGGYTKTEYNIHIPTGEKIPVTIGDGGHVVASDDRYSVFYNAGGNTSILGITADGGQPGLPYRDNTTTPQTGGDGGSGGGAGGHSQPQNRRGYSDGAGCPPTGSLPRGGTGQEVTTRAFAEERGRLYSGGGAGAGYYLSDGKQSGGLGGGAATGQSAQPNTGGGGGGGGGIYGNSMEGWEAGNGGSGVVLIRPSIGSYTYVSPPETIGNRYRYRIKKVSQVGEEYDSDWTISSNTLRRALDPFGPYTDEPLTKLETPVKAVHMKELQDRIQALRNAGYDKDVVQFTEIKAGETSLKGWKDHVEEIRNAYDGYNSNHDEWIMIDDNCPKTEVIEQIRDLIDLDNMATVDFYSFGSWVHTQTVRSGGDITYNGPEMLTVKGENDDHIFVGWGDTPDGPVNASILKNVLKSKKAYAIYEKRFRGWNAYFYNGDELIFTAEGIPDGGSATYLGRPQKQGVLPSDMFEFDKWSQAPVDMHSNAYCYAQYKCPALTETITDSWSEIFEHIDDGTYSTRYRIGDTKILDIGTEGMVTMEIVAFDADDKAYEEGKAPISWLAMQALPTEKIPWRKEDFVYVSGRPWVVSYIRSYLDHVVYQQISKDIRTRILEVEKIVNAGRNEEKVYDKLWIPHYYEFRDDYDDQYHPGWSFPRYTTKLSERKDLNGRSRKSYTRHTVYNEEYDEARAVIISLGPSVSSYEETGLDSYSYANVVFGFCT